MAFGWNYDNPAWPQRSGKKEVYSIDMRENKLRKKISKGEPTLGTRVLSAWPGVIEIVGQSRQFDYVEFLAEYAPYNLYDFENLARASELYDMSSMIKVGQGPWMHVGPRALDSGIQNVLFADIRTKEDARKCVEMVRAETPRAKGIHGSSMGRNVGYVLEGGSSAFVDAMNDSVVAIMIEKESAVRNLKNILSVEGIDMVHFGASDYAMSLGLPGQVTHSRVRRAERTVIATALEMGIAPRVHVDTVGDAEKYIDLGVRHFTLGVDLKVLYNWSMQNGGDLRNKLLGKRE